MRKNCSSDREKLMKFEAEGREFAKFLRSIEQLIQTVKRQNFFGNRMFFITCSWRFLRSNMYIRTIIIQIGKMYWDLETSRKIFVDLRTKKNFKNDRKLCNLICNAGNRIGSSLNFFSYFAC